MLLAWREGIEGLRDKRIYAMGDAGLGEAFSNLPDPESTRSSAR
jgi:serine/threonine-protein kinase HipA